MATFDQLAADQRAIIELVLNKDRSYEEIGDMLDLPPSRVRELARDALGDLAPFTAEFVDPHWRGQLADYVLGQQTGPESQATRGHLRRSEPARIWAYSLLDALDDFFEDGERPEIPVGEAGGRPRRAATREPEVVAPNGEAPASAVAPPPRRARTGGALSPAAAEALKRRRIIGGVAGLVVLALLVFGATQIFGGGGSSKKKNTAATSTGTTGVTGGGQIIAQALLSPIGAQNKSDQGVAIVYQQGKQSLLVLRAKLKPSTGAKKYVIWLYNSEKQLQPVAADNTDKSGNFQGAQKLPNGWQNYHFVDVTLQSTSGKQVSHGTSVLRGPITAPSAAATGTTGKSGTTGP